MSESQDWLDVQAAQSAPEAAARWVGNVILFGDDVNSRSADLSDRIVSTIRQVTFKMPSTQLVESIVSHLAVGIAEDYDNTRPYLNKIRGERIATDGNSIPTPILGKAMLEAGVDNSRKAITDLLPPDVFAQVEDGVVLAKLGRMTPLEQVWPPVIAEG